MDKSAKIYRAGHQVLVDSILVKNLKGKGYNNLATRIHAELDLADQKPVEAFFPSEQPILISSYSFLPEYNDTGPNNYHNFEDLASRKLAIYELNFPISLTLEATVS